MERIDIDDGKYTVINNNGKLIALRYGEPWREDDLVGDKLVHAMVVEILALRAALEACMPYVLHYADFPGNHSDAHKHAVNARRLLK